VKWSTFLLEKAVDSYGKHYGNKTATLEAIGVMLPLLSVPEILAGKHVVVHVDNIAVVCGLEKGSLKGDTTASIFIRAILVLCGYLGVVLHANHVPRRSTRGADLADQLTRQTSSAQAVAELGQEKFVDVKSRALARWIQEPSENWDLVKDLVKEVEQSFIV